MNQAKFAVIRFENRNGAVSWRVDGSLNGIRFRKNFKTKGEAAAEKGVLELRAMQDKSGSRCATTFLADADLRQAEDGFRRLQGRARPLLEYQRQRHAALHNRHSAKPPGHARRGSLQVGAA
jgi:hypothetical protein